ncbi:hypothetical protein IAU60_004047 [Kwoniella sp. DSM 27419]
MLRLHPRQLLRRSSPTARPGTMLSPRHLPPRLMHTYGLPPFKPPPIRQRLKPLIPFFIYWTIITSLAVHLLRARIASKEELDKRQAQISVLSTLIGRIRAGDRVDEVELQRELEMVGLRERTALTREVEGEMDDTADVGWAEVLFGKKRKVEDGKDDQERDEKTLEEWVQVVNEASTPITPPTRPSSIPHPPPRQGETRRAPSSNVYM